MSVVTNVILTTEIGGLRDGMLEQVNAFFEPQCGFRSIKDSDCYGGTKVLECDMAIGAFNHLHLDSLIEHLQTKVNWQEAGFSENYMYQSVQLIVKESEDERFRIIDVAKYKYAEVTP